ncbi:MAG: hypothetical protein ACI9FR_001863 [Cryomorphaceae bacterium]|jgi:hypothetical protein
MKNLIKLLIISVTAFVSSASWALAPIYTGYFSDQAIKGYDIVAYFTENKPIERKE